MLRPSMKANSTEVVISRGLPVVTISVAAGGIYTAIARDNTGGAGGLPLGLILLDDFNL